jgi:hypothetical protein
MGISVFPAAGGGVTQKVAEYTSTGTFVVPSNCTAVEVFAVGAGGGGGGSFAPSASAAGGGGGGGEVQESRTIPVTAGASYTITVGAGGAGATTDVAGGYGNDSSFGSLLVAQGGGGGGTYTSAVGVIPPSLKATMGSYHHTSENGIKWGQGAARIFVPGELTQPFTFGGPPTARSGTYAVTYGSASAPNFTYPGLGVQGFGGGGCVGGNNTSGLQSFDNGAPCSGSNAAGINAAANKGGGGGGGSKSSTNPGRSGGNGGSGYVRITYWS